MTDAPFSARLALFDNSEAQSENESSPAMTGRLEISPSQIELLFEKLVDAPTESYGTRSYKVIDVALWDCVDSGPLKYSGKCKFPMKKKKPTGNDDQAMDTPPTEEPEPTLKSSEDGEIPF